MKQVKLISNNKKARYDYFIDDVYEAGMVLTGTEIKSLRQGKAISRKVMRKLKMESLLFTVCI